MNRDIISFVNPASPALLINMAILGRHFGLASLPELTIIDEISQTAGRNKGFRSGGCDHVMIINHYVWAFISPAIRNARYRFAINEEAVHRRDRKAA